MKQAFIKDRKEFDKVAPKYGFLKRSIGEYTEHWYKTIGKVELYIFNLSSRVSFYEKGKTIFKGKKYTEKYIADILHLVEWK